MSRAHPFLIYGATGYTGKLTAREAHAQGLRPMLAGRNEAKLRPLAEELGLPWRAFDLADQAKLDAALAEVPVVLHIAGPFSATSQPMADACLRTRTHYLDITGEISVFEALAARDAEARRAGIMLLPGVGFDVVPSDCLAAHVKRRLPDADDLKLYLRAVGHASRGTAKSAVESIAKGTLVRRDGAIGPLASPPEDMCDFGAGPRPTIAVSWGDVSTAYHSTGIPNIEVHFEARPELRRAVKMPNALKSLLGRPFMQTTLKRLIDRGPEGPSDEQRRRGQSVIIATARNKRGDTVRSRLRTPDGYTLTAVTGPAIAMRVGAGDFKPGFQTPSLAFGADLIMDFADVTREDLDP